MNKSKSGKSKAKHWDFRVRWQEKKYRVPTQLLSIKILELGEGHGKYIILFEFKVLRFEISLWWHDWILNIPGDNK